MVLGKLWRVLEISLVLPQFWPSPLLHSRIRTNQAFWVRLFLCWITASAHLAEGLFTFIKKNWDRKEKRVEEGAHYCVVKNIRKEAGSFITDSSLLPSRWYQWRLAGTKLWWQSSNKVLPIQAKSRFTLKPALPQLQVCGWCSKRSGLLKTSQE